MRKFWAVCLTATFVAVIAAVSSAAPGDAKKTGTTHSARGTIEACDPAAHSLTLKTAKGNMALSVDPDAKVWVGSKSASVDDLSKQVGSKATVSYTESGGQKTAKTVRVAPSTTKPKGK